MYLSTLTILNFRNLIEQKIEFEKNLNIIHGDNAQGKTSVLEAIHFLSISRSFRSNSEKLVLQHTKEHFDIKGYYTKSKNENTTIRVFYSLKDGKHIFVNENKLDKFSELIGIIPVILLSLEDLELTYGYPANRRRFADVLLSQISPLYLNALQRYKQSLIQRNRLLGQIFEKKQNKNVLYPWNEQLIQYGTEIAKYRYEFIRFLNENLSKYYRLVSDGRDHIKAEYKSGISDDVKDFDIDAIKIKFREKLDSDYFNDLNRQTTTIGPRRDDIEFRICDQPIKSFGSQGENKTFLIALKFIESEYLRKKLKTNPVFLLDDIFGELDNKRIEHLTEQIASMGQAFITTTLKNKFSVHNGNDINYLEVSQGKVLV